MGKKIMVFGSGGREHALAWTIAKDKNVEKIYYTGENAGIEALTNANGDRVTELFATKDPEEAAKFAKENDVGLVVFGPEAPLVAGGVDTCERYGVRAFGPSASAAQLEGSKIFTKLLLKELEVPTADFVVCDTPEKAQEYARKRGGEPLVIKADGLAAGKGAIVCKNPDPKQNLEEQLAAIEKVMVKREFGDAGKRVVIEDFMAGEEASILAFVDGERIRPLTPTQDHKPAYDNDEGPNTGGMGAYGPAPVVTHEISKKIGDEILKPVVAGMAEKGMPYKGILYAGLMVTDEGPKVVEFNVRFGDPEVQPTVMLYNSSFLGMMEASAAGDLGRTPPVGISPGVACGVVMASNGYPGSYEKGRKITGLDGIDDPNVVVFHAGTKRDAGDIVTAGGRVLCVTAYGNSFRSAIGAAYDSAHKIKFIGPDGKDEAQYRTDIGAKALARFEGK